MEIILETKPRAPTIIQGLPGIGMVGAIAAEFLIQHLDTKKIGKIILDNSPPLIALHDGKLIEPFSIYYNKKFNLVIVHSIVATPGSEFPLATAMIEIGKALKAKNIISLEGIGSPDNKPGSSTFYYSTSTVLTKSFDKAKINKLKEGIVMGQAASLLMKKETIPISCIFAETHSTLPDSKAAAEIIKALDATLGLKVDYKPLLKVAAQFEDKIRGIMQQSEQTKDLQNAKQLNYVG